MRIALVADLHGNLPATLAVDADIRRRGVDAIWCLGDLVGKGPSSAETFDWAWENCNVILRGNWDEGVGVRQFSQNDGYYYDQLGEDRLRKLCGLPYEHHCTLAGRHVRLLHGRPVMPVLQATEENEDQLAWLFAPDFSLVAYADIHRPGLRSLHGDRLLFSVGSVGNSLRTPMAQYALLTCEEGPSSAFGVQFIFLPYDTAQAVRDAEASPGMPRRDAYIQEITTGVYGRKPK